jgi:hypothetical protein
MKKRTSRDQLSDSLVRRQKHLMVKLLDSFERHYPEDPSGRTAALFKGDIKTACNDVIRCTRDELRDYTIEYTPLRLGDDNVLALTREFLQTVQKVEFDFSNQPCIRFYASNEKRRVLDAVRAEFGDGVMYEEDEGVVLQIVGLDSCVRSVLPIMDKYRFQSKVRVEYNVWRKEVVKAYKDQVNG